jgi:hypothetical protein
MASEKWFSLRSDLGRAALEVPPDAQFVCRQLAATPFSRGCCVRSPTESVPFPLAVAFMPFRWDDAAPWLWLATTIGLSSIRQATARPSGYRTPERLELALAVREPAGPEWLVFRRAWEDGGLGKMETVPAILTSFHAMALDVASWMLIEKESFTFGDTIQNAALTDRFPSVLLMPPLVELLTNGLAPVRRDGTSAEIPPGDWMDTELLQSSGECVFVEAAPLLPEEYVAANRQGGSRFLGAGLLPTEEEFASGLDASAFVTDLQRASRLPTFTTSIDQGM